MVPVIGETEPVPARGHAMPFCNLPEDIIVVILSKLPVKSLIRFKCVCKHWLSLLESPRFVSMQLNQSTNLNDDSIIVHGYSLEPVSDQHITLFQTSNHNVTVTLDHPFPRNHFRLTVVGSINGLVCLSGSFCGRLLVLWNPATRQFKRVPDPLSTGTVVDDGDFNHYALGFCFDSVSGDYKIVRIWQVLNREERPAQVQVYSANEDSWRAVRVEVPLLLTSYQSDVILKGVPFWEAAERDPYGRLIASGYYRDRGKCPTRRKIMSFDCCKEVFRQFPMPEFDRRIGTYGRLVNYKDTLGFAVCYKESSKCLDLWVMDESGVGDCWSKEFTAGPISDFKWPFVCSGKGDILVENEKEELCVYCPQTREIKNVKLDVPPFRAYQYTETLVSIGGFKRVQKEAAHDIK